MHFNHNELVLIYDAESNIGKKTLAYANTITSKINRQDIRSVRVSPTLFEKAIVQTGLGAKELINKADEYYQENLRGREFENEEWFQQIIHRPELLKAPIALYYGKGVLCNSETDILKLKRLG